MDLFSRPGGSIVRGCYCMYYRKAGPTPPGAGEANKKAMKSGKLLMAAIDYARSRGARLLEAYPIDKRARSHPDFMFFGAKSLYDRAGFKEVARRTDTRPVVRRALRPPRKDT